MASVGFGTATTVAAVAPASGTATGTGRRRIARRSVLPMPPAATRGSPAPAKEEKSLVEFIFGVIFKKDQLVETDPLLNKVEVASRAKAPPPAGKKAPGGDDGGSGGFNLAGLFAKKG